MPANSIVDLNPGAGSEVVCDNVMCYQRITLAVTSLESIVALGKGGVIGRMFRLWDPQKACATSNVRSCCRFSHYEFRFNRNFRDFL